MWHYCITWGIIIREIVGNICVHLSKQFLVCASWLWYTHHGCASSKKMVDRGSNMNAKPISLYMYGFGFDDDNTLMMTTHVFLFDYVNKYVSMIATCIEWIDWFAYLLWSYMCLHFVCKLIFQNVKITCTMHNLDEVIDYCSYVIN